MSRSQNTYLDRDQTFFSSSCPKLLLAIVCSLQITLPAYSQTAVLSGGAVRNAISTPLQVQQPNYDYTPVQTAPPTKTKYGHVQSKTRLVRPQESQFQTGNIQSAQSQPIRSQPMQLHGGAAATAEQPAPRPAPHYVVSANHERPKTYWQRHPMVKKTVIGAGIGAGAGAATGMLTGRGVLHGALVGGGAGAGVGALRASKTMQRHPYMRDGASGLLAGLGLGAAAGGRHSALAGAAIGGALGTGFRYYENNMK